MFKGCTRVCKFKKYFSSGCRLRSVYKQRSEPEYLFWMSVKRRESLYTSYYLWFWSRWKAANTKCLLLSYYTRATACLEWLKSGNIFLRIKPLFPMIKMPLPRLWPTSSPMDGLFSRISYSSWKDWAAVLSLRWDSRMIRMSGRWLLRSWIIADILMFLLLNGHPRTLSPIITRLFSFLRGGCCLYSI